MSTTGIQEESGSEINSMEQSQGFAQRLVPALPVGEFVNKPPEIDRFVVRVWPDGKLYFKGSRERIDEFLRLCVEEGLEVQVDHIALCG
ncbi:MAG: hypothetical protein ACYDER_08400 [Ktedonobacteraceae bacterium]